MPDKDIIDYDLGQNIKVYKKVGEALDARADAGHNLRISLENTIITVTPTWDNENIKPGTLAGAVTAAITLIADDYAVPTTADTEIVDSEIVEDGVRYKVNVDSSFKQQARFRAMMEAGQGFVSLVTDKFEYNENGVLRKRPARDTWQFVITVKDKDDNAERGFGVIG
jgi:hypothetical protein